MGSTILRVLLLMGATVCVSADFLMGGHLDNTHAKITEETEAAAAGSSHLVLARTAEDDDDGDLDLIAEESGSSVASTVHPDQEPRYKVPYAFAFNGGKPFSLEKDPITGKIDFEKTPPVKALNLSETYREEEAESDESAKLSEDYPYGKVSYLDSKRVVSTNSKNERVGPNEINPYSPSFHDFLNLPVRYTSDKYDRENYPLISSSYANTKVQSGSNSYNINNHRPYHQETATKMSISTATRKVYYPKPTTSTMTPTTTTTTTTPRPETTTTTTMRPTTAKPVEKKTTTATPTKPPTTTTTPSTTRAVPTTTSTTTPRAPVTQPKITTWKPNKSTTHFDEYEEMLPIEKLQGTKYGTSDTYGQYPIPDKELNGHSNGPQSPPRGTTQATYDYNDGYEDYEASPEDHAHPMHDHREVVHRVELTSPPSITTTTMSTTTSTTSAPTTAPTTTTPAPTTPTEHPMLSIHLTTAKPLMLPIHQQQPVTSMPLDSGSGTGHLHIPPVHENFVEGHRPLEFHGGNNNGHPSVLFPGSAGNVYRKPGSVINVLPESTSNVIVPHDQDTVSFVLGNRQNVEGSYYTHGTAMEEHPYAPNTNENNFRPIYNTGLNGQQPGMDQQVSVGLSSVSVVDSSQSNFNPPKWYNPSSTSNQGPVTTTIFNENESQNGNPQAPVVFPADNSKKDASTQTEDSPSQPGFVAFPDSIKDRNDETVGHNNNNNQQRPVEEHIIVINQADGTIKEITPTGATNIENTLMLGGNGNGNVNNNNNNNNNDNNNNNNPNLPQLSENLTPPAESRPLRPLPGGNNQRPPYYFHYQHGNGPQGKPGQDYPPRPQRIPLPPRQKPEPPPVGFKRRPTAPHDQKLPNILPQFRPNAKTSHGHRGPDKIGTLPAPQSYNSNNRQRPTAPQPQPPHLHPSRRPQPHAPISPPPSHLQRLSPPPLPPPQQQGHPHQQVPVFRKKDETPVLPIPEHLKRYRPPVSASSGRPPIAQKLRMEDEIATDRFSAEPPQVPPRPIIFPKNRADSQMPKVATLQMIQQRGGLDEEIIRSNLPPVFKVNRSDEKEDGVSDDGEGSASEADRRKGNDGDGQDAAGAEAGPVYVVYPVNSAVNIGSQEDNVERDESVVIGTRGPHRPLPPDTLPQDEDDKGPGYFYGKKPHHNTINSDFGSQGYPLDLPEHSVLVREKPLLVPTDGVDDEEELPLPPTKLIEESINNNPSNPSHSESTSSSLSDSSFNVISYLQDFLPFGSKKQQPQQPQTATISATLPRLPIVRASSPIAYVYTPTTPSALHRHDLHLDDDDEEEEEERPILPDRRDEKPVLLPSQQPSSSSSSAPSPQNFMAPFVASVSAEMPAKNGWSVVAPPLAQVNGTERTKDEKAPVKEESEKQAASQENEAQTERSDESFDAENFKPQLFGGFKPIYEFPVDDEEHTPMGGRAASRAQDQNVNVNAESGRKLE